MAHSPGLKGRTWRSLDSWGGAVKMLHIILNKGKVKCGEQVWSCSDTRGIWSSPEGRHWALWWRNAGKPLTQLYLWTSPAKLLWSLLFFDFPLHYIKTMKHIARYCLSLYVLLSFCFTCFRCGTNVFGCVLSRGYGQQNIAQIGDRNHAVNASWDKRSQYGVWRQWNLIMLKLVIR